MTKASKNLALVVKTYEGSNGDATIALYNRLERLGPSGVVALNLFRALKNSTRAKRYRGGIRGKGSYRSMAYERKQWAIGNLARMLSRHGQSLDIAWGWGRDDGTARFEWVLYVEIPTGQVSFHTDSRGAGPDYVKPWDGARGVSQIRIVRWCARLLDEHDVAAAQRCKG